MASELRSQGGGAAPAQAAPPKVEPAAQPAATGAPVEGKPVAWTHYAAATTEAAALKERIAALEGEVATERARFGTFAELSGAVGSTNTKVLDLFGSEYDALPKTDRPTRKAWVDGLKAELDKAPEHLRPFLGATAQPAAAVDPKPPQPKVPGTAPTAPGAAGSVTPAEIRAAKEHAVKTGDWSKWRAIRASLGLPGAAK